MKRIKFNQALALLTIATAASSSTSASEIDVHVISKGVPLEGAKVKLWTASSNKPEERGVVVTNENGKVTITMPESDDKFYYLTAAKDKTELMLALGKSTPRSVTLSELSTIASVFTHAQFINKGRIQGPDVSLAIASGHVKNLVNPKTGLWGERLLDGINSTESETMSRMGTLGNLMALCANADESKTCHEFLHISGKASSTLTAIEHIAKQPWSEPEKYFALHNKAYPAPKVENPQPRSIGVTYVPYLQWSPDDYSLSIRIAGGGIYAAGRLAFDKDGHLWSGQNWMPGGQNGAIRGLGGGMVKLDVDGTPLSPPITGFPGMEVDGIGWGTAVIGDQVWATSFNSTIGVYDLDGKPLAPESGITLGGKVAEGQGIAVDHQGTVWVANATADNLIKFPKGDITKGEVVDVEGLNGPFSISVSNNNTIYVTNALGANLTQFPANDPKNVKQTTIGISTRGLDIDNNGNIWVASLLDLDFPPPEFPEGKLTIMKEFEVAYQTLVVNANRLPTGQISLITPDGKKVDFVGDNHEVNVPWGLTIDGNGNIWVGNFLGASVLYFCGATGNCPDGYETGDLIHNFESGIIQSLTDASVDAAGNVWAANNWNVLDAVVARNPTRKDSTRGGGSGLTVIYGLAAPVKWPREGAMQPMN